MLIGQYGAPEPATLQVWTKALQQYRRSEGASLRPRERRGVKRQKICAFATLTAESAENDGHPTVYLRCPVLDASPGDLAVQTQRKIAPGTTLRIDLILGDMRLGLTGRVLRNQGFPGHARVVVKLEFAEEAGSS